MKWIICLAFVLLNSAGIFAQPTVNTESEFLTALDKANRLVWSFQPLPYRTVHTGEIILNSKKDNLDKQFSSYKTVSEYDRKIGGHTIYELSKNSVKEKYESIWIRGKNVGYFERNDDGDWQRVAKLSKIIAGGLAVPDSREYKKFNKSSETNQATVDYKYLGNEKVYDQVTDVYMTVEKLTEAETSGKIIRTQTRKFWFAQDGKILRLDVEIILENDAGCSRSNYTQTWETDENIKIEVPKLPAPQ